MEDAEDLKVAPGRGNAELACLLPHPAADANKYTRGHLSLVVGSAAYPGAACLAAAAGERGGAGYTEVFCAGKSMITVRGWRPSLVVRDWRAWKPAKAPAPRPGHPTACVIGCGFDAAETSLTSLLMETVRGWEAPLLIDGGALGLLANATGLRLARERAAAGASLEEVAASLSEEDITEHLYTKGQPDPDLVIRTSGEQRLSGFLLWQSVHSEYYFCEVNWPAFRRVDFLRALRDFASRERRLGR